jgi:hypothetical protein
VWVTCLEGDSRGQEELEQAGRVPPTAGTFQGCDLLSFLSPALQSHRCVFSTEPCHLQAL